MQDETPKWKHLQDLYDNGGVARVFSEGLGWSSKKPPITKYDVDDVSYEISTAGELKGYWVVEVRSPQFPSPRIQSKIDRGLSEIFAERILIFSDGIVSTWRWPRATPSGGISYESVSITAEKLPAFVAQRLVGLAFNAKDFSTGVSLVDVRDRVRGRFDASKVTKKFFDEFKKRHMALAESIVGLSDPTQKSSYATLILNRLMLLYFLQKREFLNDDSFYLENCLAAVRRLQGEGKFFSFYRNFLLPLFFDHLASPQRESIPGEVQAIIGDIPYINGGIYEPSEIERDSNESLDIPDAEFVEIFRFFGRFNWHLDTRPSGSDYEINPEVIGYIFEQYVNYTAGGKKENGAYYTPEDVTGYMVDSVLLPRVFDSLEDLGIRFADLVRENPIRYIHGDLFHGFSYATGSWAPAPEELIRKWQEDPISWGFLDGFPSDDGLCLAGETWVEMFDRREYVDRLRIKLSNAPEVKVDDLITLNLNARLLLTDAIDRLSDSTKIAELWAEIVGLRVLDPTCGSGAFLFAAMEALEDIYSHLLGLIQDREIDADLQAISNELGKHPNQRYFIRKTIALNNLFGVDIMPDAVETAKLRVFLSLISCLEKRSELEPLPDLDFNIKCGNLLLGIQSLEMLDEYGGDLVAKASLEELAPELEEHRELLDRFRREPSLLSQEGLRDLKKEISRHSEGLRASVDETFSRLMLLDRTGAPEWFDRHKPFHWFVEFSEVEVAGGFDVIVGNPPYVRISSLGDEQRAFLRNFETARCPDLYASCVEQSLKLLSGNGRFSMIVPLSASFSNQFDSLRQAIRNHSRSEWWSSYGKRPAKLFEGAHLISNILVLGPRVPNVQCFATHHNIFSRDSRRHLFCGLRYFAQESLGVQTIKRAGALTGLAETLNSLDLPDKPESGASVFLRPTGLYWFPVLPVQTASYDANRQIEEEKDLRLVEVSLREQESAPLVTALLGGKIGYFWWSCVGDDFDINRRETIAPRALASIVSGALESHPKLKNLIEQLWANFHTAVILVSHNGFRVNLRWNLLRDFTDPIDAYVLRETGLFQYWRELNIWYRKVMRAGGASSGDQQLSGQDAKALMPLPRLNL